MQTNKEVRCNTKNNKIDEIVDTVDTALKLIAQGNTAEVYQYDDTKILKLFRDKFPKAAITTEYKKVKCIQSKLDNIPKAYEVIERQNRYGIIYEKINGSNMLSCMLKNLFTINKYAKMMAQTHFKLHKVTLNLESSVKEKLSREIDRVSILEEEEKNRIQQYLQMLPEGESLCHFDFHPGNIIMRGTKPIVIDWMTACSGNPNADAARTYLILQSADLPHANRLVNCFVHLFEKHIGKIYIKEYIRLSGITEQDFRKWLLPIATARLTEWISENEKKKLMKFIRLELENRIYS